MDCVDFAQLLESAVVRNKSHLCVGLDPALDWDCDVLAWGLDVVEATQDLVCCYKPNVAFYEARGWAGWKALGDLIARIPSEIPVILDAKRADVPNTATAYAHAAFETLNASAVTINPYMGTDAVRPFLNYPGRAVFVCCRTSNPDASEFQDLAVSPRGRTLFEEVATHALEWSRISRGSVGLVAGATESHHIPAVRKICPDQWLLVPGVGPQGGDLEGAVQAADSARGRFIINASRSVALAPSPSGFANAARQAAERMRDRINAARPVPA